MGETRMFCCSGIWQAMRGALGRKVSPGAATFSTPFDPWAEAKRRKNRLILARLRPLRGGPAFCVATYHMPCLFGSAVNVQVVNIHAALAAQKVLSFAAGRPCILMGDFNFMPDCSPSRFLTSAALP